MKNNKIETPTYYDDGACKLCLGKGLCDYHKIEGVKRDKIKSSILRSSAVAARIANIDYICARYELESDELFTADEKAISILDRR